MASKTRQTKMTSELTVVEEPPLVVEEHPPLASLTALEAAAELNALHGAIHQLMARMMECAWVIRRQLPGDEAFAQFIAARTVIDPKTAARMVETWEIARQHRGVRELANRDPDEAMSFVAALSDYRREGLANADPEVVRLLTMPRSKWLKELKRLKQQDEDIKNGGHPSELVKTLTVERDAALDELEAMRKVTDIAGTPHRRLVSRFERLEVLKSELLEESTAAIEDFQRGDYGALDDAQLLIFNDQLAALTLLVEDQFRVVSEQFGLYVFSGD